MWFNLFFAQIIPDNQNYFQWMEVVIEWVIKMGYRNDYFKTWM